MIKVNLFSNTYGRIAQIRAGISEGLWNSQKHAIQSKAWAGFRPYYGEFGKKVPYLIVRSMECAKLSIRIGALLCIHDDAREELRDMDDNVMSGVTRCHTKRTFTGLFTSLNDDDRAKLLFALSHLYRNDESFDAASFAGTIFMLRLTGDNEVSQKINELYQRSVGLVYSYGVIPDLRTAADCERHSDETYAAFGNGIRDLFGLPHGMIPVPVRPNYFP